MGTCVNKTGPVVSLGLVALRLGGEGGGYVVTEVPLFLSTKDLF